MAESSARNESRPPRDSDSPVAASWSPAARSIASVIIVLHLAAVFVAPFAFACRVGPGSSSPFADSLAWLLRPYVRLAYLDHGYFFFAPTPGPSHLVRYRVEFNDGRAPVEGTFPDLASQRPRLLYHRHFMIAEFLYAAYTPPEPPPEPRLAPAITREMTTTQRKALEAAAGEVHRQQVTLWKHQREQYEALHRSLEEHLKAAYGASRVTITRVEHRLLTPDEFLILRRLDLPQSYEVLPDGPPVPEVIRP